MNKRYPRYPDDADYQTNAPSYYEDLARKQKLIKLLAEKIWQYDERLDERLEDLENVLQDYLAQWDERIENLDDEVSHIFVTWLEDGTLEKIINHDVLGNKADKDYVDDLNENITSQLTQTEHLIADIMQSNIYNFGAKNNFSEGNENFDNTEAIQNAVDFALSKEGNGIVYIPNGYFEIYDEILIPGSIKITGSYEKGDVGNQSTSGSHIRQKTENKDLFKFTGNAYGVEISKLRLGGKGGIGINTVSDFAFSEFIIEKIHFNGGFEWAIKLKGSIGRISDCDFSANRNSIDFVSSVSVWVEHNNFWDCAGHHLNFTRAVGTHFNNNWAELSGDSLILIQSPAVLQACSFNGNTMFTYNEQLVIEINGNRNPNEILSLKDITFNKNRMYVVGGIDSPIRISASLNTHANKHISLYFHDTVFGHTEISAIETDYKYINTTFYKTRVYRTIESGVPTGENKWVTSKTGVKDIVYTVLELGNNISTNGGITFLPHNKASFNEHMLYLNSGGSLTFRKDGAGREIITASNKTPSYYPPTTVEDVNTNLTNLMKVLGDTGIINGWNSD